MVLLRLVVGVVEACLGSVGADLQCYSALQDLTTHDGAAEAVSCYDTIHELLCMCTVLCMNPCPMEHAIDADIDDDEAIILEESADSRRAMS